MSAQRLLNTHADWLPSLAISLPCIDSLHITSKRSQSGGQLQSL